MNISLIIQHETHHCLQGDASLSQRNTHQFTGYLTHGSLTLWPWTLKTESPKLPLQKLVTNMSFHFCLFPTSTLACHTPLECRSPLPAPSPYLCTSAQGNYWQMQEVVFQPLQGFVDYIYHCPYAHIGLGKNSSGFFCNTVWKNPVNILANPIQEYLVINTYGLRNGIRAWTDLILNYGGMKCLTTGLLCL